MQMRFTNTVQTWPPVTNIYLAEEENAKCAEIRIRYRGAISLLSMA